MPASKLTFRFDDRWKCHLTCARCDFVRPNGVRCKNKVCYGAPTCWQHTIALYGVRIKDSTVAGAGKGLFATKAFANGAWICPYLGDTISQACLDDRYPGDVTAPYAEQLPGGRGFADSACRRGVGAMANARFTQTGRCRALSQHNAKSSFRTGLDQLWLKATKNIAAGAEIFHHYGAQYRLEANHATKRVRAVDTRPC